MLALRKPHQIGVVRVLQHRNDLDSVMQSDFEM